MKIVQLQTEQLKSSTTDNALQVGQIFWLNGYGQTQHSHERMAIYSIDSDKESAILYKWVNLEKPIRGIKRHTEIRPASRIHGIGSYYNEGDFANDQEIDAALQKAIEAENENQLNKQLQEDLKEKTIQKGKEIITNNMPSKQPLGFIIACLHEDNSDIQADYFNYKVSKKVILDWTFKTRVDFNEFRKAAKNANINDINLLASSPKEFEHRENYTGGSGYYLGESKYSGWVIKKVTFYDNLSIEQYYETAGHEDSFFAISTNVEKITTNKTSTSDTLDINIIDYSDKAIALAGNTKPIKDQLLNIGGRYNPNLRSKDGEKFAGWIFSKKRKDDIENLLLSIKKGAN